jgi:hypothetical protein
MAGEAISTNNRGLVTRFSKALARQLYHITMHIYARDVRLARSLTEQCGAVPAPGSHFEDATAGFNVERFQHVQHDGRFGGRTGWPPSIRVVFGDERFAAIVDASKPSRALCGMGTVDKMTAPVVQVLVELRNEDVTWYSLDSLVPNRVGDLSVSN